MLRTIETWGVIAAMAMGGAAWAQPAVTQQVPAPGSHIGPGDLGEQRELTQVNLKLDPPRLQGTKTDLRVENGALVGTLAGDKYNARVGSDRIVGVGPFGKIDLAVTAHPGELRFDGVWNGQPLHTSVSPNGIKGHAFRMAQPGAKAVQSCDFRIDEPKGNVLGGQAVCMGGTDPLRFSIQTPGRASLLDEETALLLTAFLAGPGQPPASPRP
jgi:hypothetical protein